MNLCNNSKDAMSDGGTIIIETKNVHLSQQDAEDSNMNPGDYVLLKVSDTGTGMDEEAKAHAFEAFFTTKPKGKGTGLGLVNIQRIVRDHG